MLSRHERTIAIVFLSLFCIFSGFDLAEDIKQGSTFFHLIEESLVMGFSLFFLVFLWSRYTSLKTENTVLQRDLTLVRTEFNIFKDKAQHHIDGLSHLIDDQFEKWGLTKSEKEVALLLLKGLAAKEIAEVRDASVKTISQQCSAVYEKSKLGNRAELAAYFLEDLFLPPEPSKDKNLNLNSASGK
jgi:DNA-binding CsgD family transcriptional regulator